MRVLLGAAILLVAGCSGEMDNAQEAALVENAIASAEAIAENITQEARRERVAARAPERDAWVGKWTGVEGLYLTIEKGDRPGLYRITNKWGLDEDMDGTYRAFATSEGIAFRRPDRRVHLEAGNGAASGLKWLEGKRDCLIVAPGEGYCRD